MDSNTSRDRRKSSTTDPVTTLGTEIIDLFRTLAAAGTADDLERLLLAVAVHPAGPGFDRARLLLWDPERERFTVRGALRPPVAVPLAEILTRRDSQSTETPTSFDHADGLAPEDLSEPAASAWHHRVRLVTNGTEPRRPGAPRVAAAVINRPSGVHGLVIGEWDESRRRADPEQLLESFVAIAEWALAEQERRAAEWMRGRQTAALAELARACASPGNLAEVLHQSVRLACQATGANGSALWLKHENELPRLEITHGSPALRDRLGRALQTIAAQVFAEGRPRLNDCAADEPLLSPDAAASVHAFAVVPLKAYERTLGVLAVYDPARIQRGAPRGFGRVELDALGALADLTAMAVDHAARFDEIQAAQVRHRELSARVARQERLADLGEGAAKAAEEARHPVASIRTFVRRTREALVEGAPEREYLEIVLRETERLERLIGESVDRAAVDPPSLSLQNLNEIVQASLQKTGEVLVRRRIRLLKKLTPELPVLLIDADRIGQMMSRVLDNALEAVSIGGRIRVETRRAGTFAVIEVAHDGPRSPGTALDHLFVPFASSRHGGGVGLAMAQRIVREHGGEVRVRADGEWSTVVVFTLPIPDNQDRRHAPHERRQIRNDRRRRVPQK